MRFLTHLLKCKHSISLKTEHIICSYYIINEYIDIRGLDGNASLPFILSCIRKPHFSSLRASDDSSLADQRIRKRRLSMIDMGNHGHVTDILLLVHDLTDLVYCEVHL